MREISLWPEEKDPGQFTPFDLHGADLSFANLRDASLTSINLESAQLIGTNLQGATLTIANLRHSILNHARLQNAKLTGVRLNAATLEGANLDGTVLRLADLRGAQLNEANLRGADLYGANLQGTDISRIHISRDTNLEDVTWHRGYVLPSEQHGEFAESESTYRMLKIWHQDHGFYMEAGRFHFREWRAGRKLALQDFTRSMPKTKNPWQILKTLVRARWRRLASALTYAFFEQVFGYGERPWRVLRVGVVVVLGLAMAYYYFGTFAEPISLIEALYYSATSFSALGYGSWSPQPQGWARYVGAAESFLGVFTIALFLVTFTRKMVR